ERFVDFARRHLAVRGGAPPLALRAAFIRSFEAETFFRAIAVRKGEALDTQHLTGSFARAVQDPVGGTSWFTRVTETLHNHSSSLLPVMNKFHERARKHLGDAWTGLGFFSVSTHPEVCWYVVADNKKERWRQWKPGDKLVICRFEMSSFYALSRNE